MSTQSCNLKLIIPIDIINELQKELTNNYEIAGTINCDSNNNIVGITKNKGNKDSVSTPNHVINFHTHPISAYNQGKTVWGWPSGEDIRESIKFALSGNKSHIVFSVEGIYVLQVNSCKIKKIKEKLNDVERGVLVFLIEEYFKCTHNFRCINDINMVSKANDGKLIHPQSYVEYLNNFDLSNLISKPVATNKNNSSFYDIPRIGGFPELTSKGVVKHVSVNNFFSKADISDLMPLTAEGKELSSPTIKKNRNVLIKTIKTVLKKLDTEKCNNTWNNSKPNSWFFVNFFPTRYYTNKMYINESNKLKSPNASNKTELANMEIDQSLENNIPYIKIFSKPKEGCTIRQMAVKNNFNFGSNISISNFGTGGTNTFGNVSIDGKQRYVIMYNFFLYPYEKLENLSKKINQFINKNKLQMNISKAQIQEQLSSLFNKAS
jgi:hypothetical protein